LTIVRPGLPLPPPQPRETVIAFDDFVGWVRTGRLLTHVARFDHSRMLVHRLESAGRPLPLALALRLMTRGSIRIEDERGRSRPMDAATLSRWLTQAATEPFRAATLLRGVERTVGALEQEAGAPHRATLTLPGEPLYLRSDLSFGVRAGGSVGHIAGVLNELKHVVGPPIFVTTDDVATVDPGIEQHLIAPSEAFWNFKELPAFVLNDTLEAGIARVLAGRTPSFVYQRYSLNNFTGLRVARRLGVPLVLEYNGSEVWVSRHWGRPLKYERLSERIERLNLRAADLLVVVSRAVKEEAVSSGAAEARVFVNPNGVDPDRYRPDISGLDVRRRYRLNDFTVLGFIGTFGLWHGAEVLARAYVAFRLSNPALAAQTRLLMIGTGATMPEVRRILSEGGAIDATVFTGLVPQEDGASHLAACDVLVSPHVPNPDGTPFFGSPTKLFEYMAMGRGIVASDLEQIGEVLEYGKTALLTPAGDADALAAALARLAADRELRDRLGAEARKAAVAHHTWRRHVARTIQRLRELVPERQAEASPA
jgi:glycosyltransferase involved in cell wall biosynthesis